VTDAASGSFRLGPLPPGRYRLWIADARPFEFPVEDVVVAPRSTTRLGRIVEPATGELRVEFGLEPGFEPAEAQVQVERGGAVDILRFDRESRVARKTCLPGEQTVTVYGTGFREQHAAVTIVPGDTAVVRAMLRPAVRPATR